MDDWDAFIDYIPWFLDAGASVRVAERRDGFSIAIVIRSDLSVTSTLASSILRDARFSQRCFLSTARVGHRRWATNGLALLTARSQYPKQQFT